MVCDNCSLLPEQAVLNKQTQIQKRRKRDKKFQEKYTLKMSKNLPDDGLELLELPVLFTLRLSDVADAAKFVCPTCDADRCVFGLFPEWHDIAE
jgi:hypothetical protein